MFASAHMYMTFFGMIYFRSCWSHLGHIDDHMAPLMRYIFWKSKPTLSYHGPIISFDWVILGPICDTGTF